MRAHAFRGVSRAVERFRGRRHHRFHRFAGSGQSDSTSRRLLVWEMDLAPRTSLGNASSELLCPAKSLNLTYHTQHANGSETHHVHMIDIFINLFMCHVPTIVLLSNLRLRSCHSAHHTRYFDTLFLSFPLLRA